MKETICLYNTLPYETEFVGKVVSCEADEDKYWVVLDQTQFFPEQGGQTPDQGIIGGVKVLDVQIKDEVISHKVEKAFEVGETVEGQVDWEYRFSNMQQHTGEHIFSGIVDEKYGYENVGFHLSDSIVTMDYSGPLTKEQVEELELIANEKIWQDIPVEVLYPTKEELSEIDYRSKKELSGQVRIVRIPDVDTCACCAPHVSSTAQVGVLKVMSVQNYKGGVRLSILCGKRALLAFSQEMRVLNQAGELLSSSMEDVPSNIEKIMAERQELRFELNGLKEQALMEEVANVSKEEEDVLLFVKDASSDLLRKGVNLLMKDHQGICGIMAGDDEKGYHFVMGSETKDMREIATNLRETLGSKGGGSQKMIQGSVISTQVSIRDNVLMR